MADMLTEALEYARRGWYVFPCREKPGQPFIREGEKVTPAEKTPYTAKGLNDATIDEDQIRAWWKIWDEAMIGINAGRSGLFVIDIDKKHVNGLDTYSKWGINDTGGLQSITPSGGMHIVFSGTGKSSTNAKTGIDTRGEGGYFIAPPSKILEGEYVGEYRRLNDWSKSPGVIPDGLLAKLFPDTTTEYVRGTIISGEGNKKKLSRTTLTFMVEGALPGERNTSLFKAAADFSGCGYTQEETREFLSPVVERMELSPGEFEQVLSHAYSKPRTASIPDSIQEKIMQGGKDIASKITFEEQTVMEDALLACMLMDNATIPIIQDILEFEDFQNLKNRLIYRTINRLHISGMKVDYMVVSNEISKETSKISLDDISKLVSSYYINVDNAITYAYIIKEKASLRKLEALLNNKSKYIRSGLVDGISSLEKDISDIALYGGVMSTSVLDSEQAVYMATELTQQRINGEITQLKTGFIDFDKHIGGFFSNELIVCGARSGDGKSALALSLVNHIAIVDKKRSLLFNIEMSTTESIYRLISQLTGIPYRNIYNGTMTASQWDDYKNAVDMIKSSPISFDDTQGLTIPQMSSKIRKLIDKGLSFVVVDQLEQLSGYEGLPQHIRLDRLAYDVKGLAKTFGIPIFLNHQVNRKITDRSLKNQEPEAFDLNQAGEKPADEVWMIVHNRDESGNIVQSKIKIVKNRNGGRLEFPVVFIGKRMLFSNPVTEKDRELFHNIDEEHEDDENTYQNAANKNIPYWARKDGE